MKVGQVLKQGGQSYWLLKMEPYQRRDGANTVLLTWAGKCAECGRGFETKSPALPKWLSRRCDEHRAPGRPASEKAKAAQAKSGKRRFKFASRGRP
jgi:hypothetical protein